MEMNANDSQRLLDQADRLETKARRSTRFLVTYFAVWGIGSAILGIVLFVAAVVGNPVLMAAAIIGWVLFIIGWLVYYYAGRRTRPRANSRMWTLAVVGGSVPWSLTQVARPLIGAESGWLAGAPWLIAGLICAACLFLAAHLADRQTR